VWDTEMPEHDFGAIADQYSLGLECVGRYFVITVRLESSCTGITPASAFALPRPPSGGAG
jgi:hypothetical protein